MEYTSGGNRVLMPGSFPASSCRQPSKLLRKASLMFSKVCSTSNQLPHSPSPHNLPWPPPPSSPSSPHMYNLTVWSLFAACQPVFNALKLHHDKRLRSWWLVQLHTAGPVARLQCNMWVYKTVNAVCQFMHWLNIMLMQVHN